MKLPNRESAYVPPEKLRGYLLSDTHPVGKSKARFLQALGFDQTNPEVLEQGLIALAQSEDVTDVISAVHGVKYVIEGHLPVPTGRLVRVRTVWVVHPGEDRPRLVTVYPV